MNIVLSEANSLYRNYSLAEQGSFSDYPRREPWKKSEKWLHTRVQFHCYGFQEANQKKAEKGKERGRKKKYFSKTGKRLNTDLYCDNCRYYDIQCPILTI